MPLTSRLRAAMRAAGLALVLGSAAVVATPSLAAPGDPSFQFRMQIPGGPSMQFGTPVEPRYCLTDREIRRQLRDYGYYDIQFGSNLTRYRVRVYASYGPWAYSMIVDRCTGRILGQKRIRPIGPPPPPPGVYVNPNPGFGLQFNFGG